MARLNYEQFTVYPDDRESYVMFKCKCHGQDFSSIEKAKEFHVEIRKQKEEKIIGTPCPKCNDGKLRLFEGPFGRFIGCDAYSGNKCKYKIQA